jgi:hypothetical protein
MGSGFDNDVVFGSNVDFSGGFPVTGKITLDGQLLIGSTALPHIRVGSLSAGTGISITTGSGTIQIATNGSSVANTITGDSGGSLSPSSGNWNLLGSGSLTTVGSGSTLTHQLTGLTNHAVLVGAGTSTITKLAVGTNGQVLLAATGADPAFATLTSTGGSITFTPGANSLNLEAGAAVPTTFTATSGTATPALNNLNILGASTAAGTSPVNTSASGSTVTVNVQKAQAIASTDATKVGLANFDSASFSVDANGFVQFTGTTFAWTDVTGTSASMAVNNGYLADNAGLVTLTLPSTAVQFSIIEVKGYGAGGWKIAQNANQKIIFGNQATTVGVGGSLASTNANDGVKLIAVVGGASTFWSVLSSIGNITVV